MVRIPRSERRRLITATDTGPRATAEQFDAGRSQVTRAVGGLVSSIIGALGSALGGMQGQQDQLSGTTAYTGFEADVSKNFNQQFVNTPPEQLPSLPQGILQDFDQRAETMLRDVPQSQQAKVQENVARLRSQIDVRAQSEAIRRGYPAQEGMINKAAEQQAGALLENPDDMEASIFRLREVAKQTQLPTWRQNEVFEKNYMNLIQAGRDGYLKRSDPEGAEAFVSKWQNYAPQLGIDTQQPGAAPLVQPPTTDGGAPGAGPRSEISPLDRDAAIRTIYGEARGESPAGQEAVAHVIRNRVLTGQWGQSATDVVRAKGQFEPWMTAEGRQRMMALQPGSKEYESIGSIVDRVFAGESPDNTKGATHFFAPKAQAALGRNAPAWAQTPTAKIGAHNFYAPKGPAHQHQAPGVQSRPLPADAAPIELKMGGVRTQPITDTLSAKMREAVSAVYGPGHKIELFSGGQPEGGPFRVGSTRHDLGKAGDIRVVDPQGNRVSGDELARLGQYWLARGYGGVGLEMADAGIHLDEHTDRARAWNYAGKGGGTFTPTQSEIIEKGLRGEMPELRGAPGNTIAGAKTAPSPRSPDWQAFRRNSDSAIAAARNRLTAETTRGATILEGEISTDFNAIKAGRPESADITPDRVGKVLGADRVETWQQQRQAARDYGAAMTGFEQLSTTERMQRVDSLRPEMPGPDYDFRKSLHEEAIKRFNAIERSETTAAGRYGKELVTDAYKRLKAGQLDGDHLETIRQHIPRRDYEALQKATSGDGKDEPRATIDLSATIDDDEPPEFLQKAQGYLRRGELSGNTYTDMVQKNEELRAQPRSPERDAIKRAFDPALLRHSEAQKVLGAALERALKEHDATGEPAAMIIARNSQAFLAARQALGTMGMKDPAQVTPDDVAMAAGMVTQAYQSSQMSKAQLLHATQQLRDWTNLLQHEAALAGAAKQAPKTVQPQKQSFKPQPFAADPEATLPPGRERGESPGFTTPAPEQGPRGEGEDPEAPGFIAGAGRITEPGAGDEELELTPGMLERDEQEQRGA